MMMPQFGNVVEDSFAMPSANIQAAAKRSQQRRRASGTLQTPSLKKALLPPARISDAMIEPSSSFSSSSRAIPFPSNYIRRTPSELDLLIGHKHAAQREKAMYNRLVFGMVSRGKIDQLDNHKVKRSADDGSAATVDDKTGETNDDAIIKNDTDIYVGSLPRTSTELSAFEVSEQAKGARPIPRKVTPPVSLADQLGTTNFLQPKKKSNKAQDWQRRRSSATGLAIVDKGRPNDNGNGDEEDIFNLDL